MGFAPRRHREAGAALLAAIFAVGCDPQTRPDAAAAANVVVVVIDTLRVDHVGAYGGARDTSPYLDAFARTAVRFERAYATAPWTKPSVASMITGLYPSAHGAKSVGKALPDEVDTLAEILAARGYATAGVVSHVVLAAGTGFAQGFERFDASEARDEDHVSSVGVTARATALLEWLADDPRPFLLFVHYFDPHYTYVRHPEFGFAAKAAGRLRGGESIQTLRALDSRVSAEEIAFLRDLYDEEVRFTDASLGRLLEALRALELDESTVVIVTADHGEEFLERGWIGHTHSLYEELVHVPLLVRVPGATPRVVDNPVSLVALTATILELLGIDASAYSFHGRSLAPILRGEAGETSAVVFAEVGFVPLDSKIRVKRAFKKAIVGERFKLIRDDASGALELYDLADDPAERRNLAERDPALRDRMLAILDEHVDWVGRDAAEARDLELSEEDLELLRGLGYVE